MRFGADLKAHVTNTVSQYNYRPHSLNLRYQPSRDQMREVFAVGDDLTVHVTGEVNERLSSDIWIDHVFDQKMSSTY